MATNRTLASSSTTTTTTTTTKRTSITVLVLGDEGVGKTSLISTFVARYFPEVVSGLMTRVRLPQDPDTSLTTTIIDSQNGDAALAAKLAAATAAATNTPRATGTIPFTSSTSSSTTTATTTTTTTNPSDSSAASSSCNMMVDNVDSLILVYDLDRIETFSRLEHHWLPLIERCYQGDIPVIVAGNKMDKFKPTSTTSAASTNSADSTTTTSTSTSTSSTRQQIVSIMSRYRFVRQWIKCSAKHMLRVDDIFLKAQQAVLYPITPLYDLDHGKMTNPCIQALSRIFRMYDLDHDHLLSDQELQKFQLEAFSRPILDKDIIGWKKLITSQYPNDHVLSYPPSSLPTPLGTGTTILPPSADNNNTENDQNTNPNTTTTTTANNNNKYFTLVGFLAIFDIFISQNRLDHCWQVLRRFGYQDDLQLQMPSPIVSSSIGNNNWNLDVSSKTFITKLFYQFDKDKDGILTYEDIQNIFSILPQPYLPPWHKKRSKALFQQEFSRPKQPPKILHSNNKKKSKNPSPSPVSSSAAGPPAASAPDTAEVSLSASGITILSAESIPTLSTNTSSSASTSIASATITSSPQPEQTRPKSSSSATAKVQSLNYVEWMGYWYMLSSISPVITQQELFRLGYIEQNYYCSSRGELKLSKKKLKKKKKEKRHQRQRVKVKSTNNSSNNNNKNQEYKNDQNTNSSKENQNHHGKRRLLQQPQSIPSREFKVLVIGSKESGKTSLLNSICYSYAVQQQHIYTYCQPTDTRSTVYPETSFAYVHIKCRVAQDKNHNETKGHNNSNRNGRLGSASENNNSMDSEEEQEEEESLLTVYLIFTEMPFDHYILKDKKDDDNDNNNSTQNNLKQTIISESYNLVLFVFDSTDASSFAYAKHIEQNQLDDDIPRIYVATKLDQAKVTTTTTITKTTMVSSMEQKNDAYNNNNPKIDSSSNDDEQQHEQQQQQQEQMPVTTAIQNAQLHCRDLDIEPPLLTTAAARDLGTTTAAAIVSALSLTTEEEERIGSSPPPSPSDKEKDNHNSHINKKYFEDRKQKILYHIAQSILLINEKDKEELENDIGIIDIENYIQRLKSRPHEEQKRRDAAWRRKMIWFGGIVGFSVVVAVGVKLLWGSGTTGASTNSTTASSTSTAGGTATSSNTSGNMRTSTTTSGPAVTGGATARDRNHFRIGGWISQILLSAISTTTGSSSSRGIHSCTVQY